MPIPRPLYALIAIAAMLTAIAATALAQQEGLQSTNANPPKTQQLMGHRFLTLNTIVRVHQIEVTRDIAHGPDESIIHTSAEARLFRETIETAWPGARITWAFSWKALHDDRPQYRELRELIVTYQKKFNDEITFIPGAYFSNMYNTREQVNLDLHEGLQRVSEIVGNGYRPKSVVAGFLSAENLRYLSEVEGIHVCQGNIWSQFAVDNGDGEGSICYPYYPSREHFCKPARSPQDQIDCVNLDGWTVDFLAARIPGQKMVDGERWRSRQGVGPIETVLDMGTERGTKSMLATTAAHFDDGFSRNGFAWVTCGWEMGLVEARKIYGYRGRNGLDALHLWLTETRKRWPDAELITQGEFGLLWRSHFPNNDKLDYQFVHRGCGIRASQENLEIQWYMNKDFRLALLRDWQKEESFKVLDLTRYDLPAQEPADPSADKPSRNWSLMNRINQKGTRPEDIPIEISELSEEDRALIRKHYPSLVTESPTPIAFKQVNLEESSETSANASLGDLDGDGDLDIVLAKGRHWPLHNRILLNDGDGAFTSHNLSDQPDRSYTAALGDIDQDGDLDIVVSNDRPDEKVCYKNDGKGSFERAGTWGESSWNTRNITLSDINGDRFADLIVSNRKSASYLILNDGHGSFKQEKWVEIPSQSATTIVTADFDRDGFVDLAVPHRDGGKSRVLFGDDKLSFQRASSFGPAVSSTRACAAVDLNDDGAMDLVLGDDHLGTSLCLNDGKGNFPNLVVLGEPTRVAYAIASTDMNGDKSPDLVVGYAKGGCRLFLNDATGIKYSEVMLELLPSVVSLGGIRKDFDKDNRVQKHVPSIRFELWFPTYHREIWVSVKSGRFDPQFQIARVNSTRFFLELLKKAGTSVENNQVVIG